MKNLPLVLRLSIPVLLSCFAPSASFASPCTQPPPLPFRTSWAPIFVVNVDPNGVPISPVDTAITNWNHALPITMGCKPILVDAGTAPIPNIDMSYIPIPPPPNDPNRVTRGITDIDHAVYIGGRIEAVEVTINSAVTSIAALTEVIAHEFGHTFGLGDCNYPGCPVGSSVMEANATVQNVNSTIGQPGPTSCDINAVILVAPDYYCTPPPLPPPICHRIQTCQEGYAWFDYPDCACEPDGSVPEPVEK